MQTAGDSPKTAAGGKPFSTSGSTSTIWTDANGRARTFSDAEMRHPVGDALRKEGRTEEETNRLCNFNFGISGVGQHIVSNLRSVKEF